MTVLRTASSFAVAFAFTMSTFAGEAHGQTSGFVERKTKQGQDITFEDDPLGALGDTPVGTQLWGFHPPKRCALMRPRTTFVLDLLKTVESL
jgi:hypothetical protein